MTHINEEQEEILEKIKNKYNYNNGYTLGIPDYSPINCLVNNYYKFESIMSSYEIPKKIDNILMKYELLKEEVDEENEEWEKIEDQDEKKVGDDIVNENKIRKINKKKIRKDPIKNEIIKELIKINEKTNNISDEAYDNFDYYLEVIDELLRKYKENYLFQNVGKIYNKASGEIIALLNNNYIEYEKNLISMNEELKNINLKLLNN